MRDRLIELLKQIHFDYCEECCACTEDGYRRPPSLEEFFADYLLENGVIVPPCKVNDPVWIVYTPRWPANPADKGKWFMIEDGVQRIIYGAKGLSIETWNMGTIPAKDIGKKLFFDKEEAERMLIERRSDNE